MTRPFKRRRRDGKLVVTLPVPVVELLRQVVDELSDVVAAPPEGAVGDRLFPRAYIDPTEERAEQDWQELVHDDLVRSRTEAIRAVLSDLDAGTPKGRDDIETVLDEAAEGRWLTVLNDARLALGTAIGVTEDEPPVLADDDPRATGFQVYALLTHIQSELVEVLLGEIPPEGSGDDPSV